MKRLLPVAVGVLVLVVALALLLQASRVRRGTATAVAAGTVFLEVHGPDPTATRLEVAFVVPVPDTMPISGRIALLCRKLSEHRFAGLPVEFLRIDSSTGEHIAEINLAEDERTGRSWRAGFFQGSTGGHFTTASLVETMLQPGLEAGWLDGVRFFYEGKPVARQWDHVVLDRTWLRTDARSW